MLSVAQRLRVGGPSIVRVVGPLLVPIALLALAAATILPTPVQTEARIRQHLLSLGIQILAAGVAAALLWPPGGVHGAADRERAVWQRLSLTSLLWAIGLLVYGMREWRGPGPSYPSVADIIFVAASLVLIGGLLRELRLVRPRLTAWLGLLLVGLTTGMAVGTIAVLLRSVMLTPTDLVEKSLNLVYPAIALFQISLIVVPALALSGSLSGRIWLGVALGVACLGLSMIGFVVLASFDLYSDIHPINLLRVAGFAVLAGIGVWRRQSIAAIVAEGALISRREPRTSSDPRIWIRKAWRSWAPAARQPREVLRAEPKRIPRPPRRPETTRPVAPEQHERRPETTRPVAPEQHERRHRPLSRVGLFLVIFILGGAVGYGVGWIISHRLNIQVTLRFRDLEPQISSAPLTPQPLPSSTSAASDPTAGQGPRQVGSLRLNPSTEVQERYRAASHLMSEGRFREAQDEYLGILLYLSTPDDEVAMEGLILARRRLTNEDPAALRRQAASYLQAAAGGVVTEEGYTRTAMEVLAKASLAAASKIEAQRLRRP
jgi:hypothetical protein